MPEELRGKGRMTDASALEEEGTVDPKINYCTTRS